MANARIGLEMFLSCCSPWSMNVAPTRPMTTPRTASETVIPPGSASAFQPRGDIHAVAVHRAVGFSITSPRCTPIRKRMRRSCCGVLSACQTLLDRQRRSDRTRRRLEHRQHRVARHVDDTALLRFDLRSEHRTCGIERATVARSSAAIRREKPAASAARMAVSLCLAAGSVTGSGPMSRSPAAPSECSGASFARTDNHFAWDSVLGFTPILACTG